jgi:hypothetical protein
MNDNRAGGWMLVIGGVAGVIVMVLHPVGFHGSGLPSPHAMQMLALDDRVVHGVALAAQPLFFLGAMALTRRLAGGNRLALAALVIYGFALVAIMIAGAMDGFVSADILSRMVEGDPKLESRWMLLDYTFRINQAFAAIYTAGSCASIFLWSLLIVKTRLLAPWLGWYGLTLAPIITLALFSGYLRPDVHGFGLVVLLQSIWLAGAGWQMASVDVIDASHNSPVGI